MQNPAEMNLDFILDERFRQLLAEENRRMMLVRIGVLVEKSRRLKGTSFMANVGIETIHDFQNFYLKMPISQSEIDLNKGAKLKRNNGC